MFMVFKNGRPAGNKQFPTYERARQYARKLCRKNPQWLGRPLYVTRCPVSNPSISDFGYSVKRV